MASPSQRLYIDESGDHTTKGVTLAQWDKRYLCLYGISLNLNYCRDFFNPRIEELKLRHFADEPDDPVILHREQMVAKVGPFAVLRDAMKNAAFREDFMRLVDESRFRAFAVLIDKISTGSRFYGLSDSHPYHIGLLAMLERYCGWLRFSNQRGDVLAESRGGREDKQLKAAYREIHQGGSRFRSPQFFQGSLSSGEIKLKLKEANIAGLQLADLLAYPAKRRILEEQGKGSPTSGFTKELADLLEKKYNRRFYNDQVAGYGKICLF